VFAQIAAPPKTGVPIILAPVGSAFCLNANADFLTAAHVVHDDLDNLRQQLSVLIHLGGQSDDVAAATILAIDRDLDLAVLRVKLSVLPPQVSFAGRESIDMGSPAASIGYPIPVSSFEDHAAEYKLTRRFSGGFISGTEARYKLWQKGSDATVYEANLLAYHGNSGGPLFDDQGRVIGLAQGTLLHRGNVAAFSLAVRNNEILPFLDGHRIEYRAAAV
jgi:S1-C subfamily serine protease